MFDAVLIASYGGPEKIADIEPFLNNVLFGKRIPPARRETIVKRYERFHGLSPLPGECRRFLLRLAEQAQTKLRSPKFYWGNLYAAPTFDEAFEEMERDEVHSVLVLATSAFGTPQSCQRYRLAALSALERRPAAFANACKLAFVPPFFDLPAVRRAVADGLLSALAWNELDSDAFFEQSPNDAPSAPTRLILFSAHSIPTSDGERSQYKRQLLSVAESSLRAYIDAPGFGGKRIPDVDAQDSSLMGFPNAKTPFSDVRCEEDFSTELKEKLRKASLDAALVFQSRSGSPRTPWLEPNAVDYLREYKERNPNLKSVVVSPLGFFFENMETIYDLDVELRAVCDELKVAYRRAECCGASRWLVDATLKLADLEPEQFPNCACAEGCCDLSCRLSVKR